MCPVDPWVDGQWLCIKAMDSSGFDYSELKTKSDIFRSVLINGKEQESQKKFHNDAKKFAFLRRFC